MLGSGTHIQCSFVVCTFIPTDQNALETFVPVYWNPIYIFKNEHSIHIDTVKLNEVVDSDSDNATASASPKNEVLKDVPKHGY